VAKLLLHQLIKLVIKLPVPAPTGVPETVILGTPDGAVEGLFTGVDGCWLTDGV